MVRQHRGRATGEIRHLDADDRIDHRISVGRSRSLYGFHPHVEADVVRLHGIVRHVVGVSRVGAPAAYECLVLGRFQRLEIVPGGEVANQRSSIDAHKLFLADGEGDNWYISSLHPLIRKLLVEGDICVAVDRRHDGRTLPAGTEVLDLRDDGLPIAVPERGVVDENVVLRDPLGLKIRLENLVGGPGVDIVGTREHPAFHPFYFHQIVDSRDRLLIGRRSGVEDIALTLLAFVLHGIEEQAVQFREHRQH